MQNSNSTREAAKPTLSFKSVKLLHRHLDDFTLVKRAKSGDLSVAELERLLKHACADPEEIHEILSEYGRVMNR